MKYSLSMLLSSNGILARPNYSKNPICLRLRAVLHIGRLSLHSPDVSPTACPVSDMTHSDSITLSSRTPYDLSSQRKLALQSPCRPMVLWSYRMEASKGHVHVQHEVDENVHLVLCRSGLSFGAGTNHSQGLDEASSAFGLTMPVTRIV